MSPRQPPKTRKKLIKQNIAVKTIPQIAKLCGVDERTIDRDIRKMRDSGEWQQWLEQEFLRLHREGDFKDDLRYKELSKLYGKTLTQKVEAKTEGEIKFIVEAWRPDVEGDPDAN